MSYTVKRQGEIKSFQFLLEGSCADFVTDVSRESVACGRARKRERSLAEFCSKAWRRRTLNVQCKPAVVLCFCYWQLYSVPHHSRRLQLPGSAAGKPRPWPGLLYSLCVLRLLHPAQHVPGHHQRHLLGGQGRHFHAEKRIRDVRLPEAGVIDVLV